ncbi:MAG: hypothetical protein ABIA74_04250 [bacterium]
MKIKINLKNIFLFILIGLSLNTLKSADYIFENSFDNSFNFENDFENMDVDLNISEAELDVISKDYTLRADQFLIFLREMLKKIDTPIWEHTKPPKGRDVLYLIPHKFTAIKYGRLDLNLLYNYTPKMNVTLENLINLDSGVTKLIELILKDSSLSSEQLSQLVPLFLKAVIQERKIAGLIQAGFTYKYFNIQIHTSLQASERNFWISKNDQQTIEDMFSGAEKTFDKKELYKIIYGLGDTRIKLGLNTINTGGVQFDVGFEGIIPTAKKQSLPDVNNSYLPTSEAELKIWMTENIKLIRDNLINPQLGNNGHFGLGFFIESKFDLFHEALKLWIRFSIDNIFEADEDRIILFNKTIDNTQLTTDPEVLSKFIRENVFPPPFRTRIKPGNIINFVSNVSFNINKRWQWGVGYDLYAQEEETIKKILDDEVDSHELRIQDAQIPQAIQHKIFSETNYSINKKNWDLILGIGADATFSSKNMGKDWTIYLRIGAGF